MFERRGACFTDRPNTTDSWITPINWLRDVESQHDEKHILLPGSQPSHSGFENWWTAGDSLRSVADLAATHLPLRVEISAVARGVLLARQVTS